MLGDSGDYNAASQFFSFYTVIAPKYPVELLVEWAADYPSPAPERDLWLTTCLYFRYIIFIFELNSRAVQLWPCVLISQAIDSK